MYMMFILFMLLKMFYIIILMFMILKQYALEHMMIDDG